MSNAESLENACLDRRDHEKIGSDATTSEEEASTSHRQPHSGDRHEKNLSFLELHVVKNFVRCHRALQEFLQHTLVADHPLVADAEVDEALVAYFNEKYRLEYSSSAGEILLGAMCHHFFGVRETRRTLLAMQPSRPPGLEAPHPAQEQGSSRVVHVVSANPGILATRSLEHGRLPVVDGDVLLQTGGTVDHSERRH